MSLGRFVYYSAVVGGWAAFLAWMLAEGLVLHGGERVRHAAGDRRRPPWSGRPSAAGLNLVSGMTNAQWRRQLARSPPDCSAAASAGPSAACWETSPHGLAPAEARPLGQVLGWMLMGLAIGLAGGIEEKSSRKCRNGAIGGALGGLLGGLLIQIPSPPAPAWPPGPPPSSSSAPPSAPWSG